MFIEENYRDMLYMRSNIMGVKHAFTTRYGGVSEREYATLNVVGTQGDDPAAVRENYRRVCALFGVDENGACVTNQVHKGDIRIVTAKDKHICLTPTSYEADGIVTEEKGLPLFCFTADCVPVLLWDTFNRAVGAIHCSWRSSVCDILKNALEAMAALGVEPSDIRSAIGPAIGSCCFETDEDVPEAITRWLNDDIAGLFTCRLDGKTMVDLRLANAKRLIQLGVPAGNIDVSDECTCCRHDKYWSHRYMKGRRGSQAAVIML